MADFEITVEYKGEPHTFPAKLLVQGYTHKIAVDVFGAEVLFELDEERNYRAVVNEEHVRKQPDLQLLKAIAEALENMAK